ncbi:MAG: hypothetical protein U0790_20450 [Isosphaeraceae bacterium]
MRTDQTMSASRVATVLLRVGGPVLSTGGRARDAAPRSARRRRRSPSVQALESRC